MAKKKQRPPSRPAKQPPAQSREGSRARLTKHQQDRRRKRRISNALWALVALALIAGILYATVGGYVRERSAVNAMTAGSCRHDERTDPGASGVHIPNPTFAVEPPAGGAHTQAVAGPGDYSSATQPPEDGQLVHALEHGYINIWYKPDLPSSDLEALKEFQRSHRIDTLLIPRSTLATPVAATAWHKRLLCDKVDIPALERFTDTYVNKGPERVPHS